MDTPLISIGRNPQCQVCISSESVAPEHARLRVYRTHAVVQSFSAAFEVRVNGVLITGTANIGQGDVIQLGKVGPTIRIIDGVPPLRHTAPNSLPDGRDQTSVGVVAGRKSSIALWVAATVLGIVSLISLGGIAIALLIGVSKSHEGRITSLHNEEKLAQAIGLVINGIEVSGDLKIQIPVNTGTAFAISPNGYMATNQHVISPLTEVIDLLRRRAPELQVRQVCWVVLDGDVMAADVVHDTSSSDFAILKVARRDMPYFRLSVTNRQPRSSEVFALGYPGAASIPLTSEDDLREAMKGAEVHADVKSYFKPQDMDFTLTKGIVSKIIQHTDGYWVQHDTVINPGNSGGPLCLSDGTVIAINTRINPLAVGNSFSYMIGQLRKEIESISDTASWSK